MNVHELIAALEDMPEDAEVRLAIQPQWAMQHHIGNVILDNGHQHEWNYERIEDTALWLCTDPDCDAESDTDERPPANDATGDDTEDVGVVYIGEAGQLYDHPYLPGSAAAELGWR